MKAASVHELRSALADAPHGELVDLCIRLSRFKKENKELITYVLFESVDEEAWIRGIRQEMQETFAAMNRSNVYFIKKSLRKILRTTGRYIRYNGSPETEVRILLDFCSLIREEGIPVDANPVIRNLYQGQLKKIEKTLAGLHEDLQYEYRRMLKQLL